MVIGRVGRVGHTGLAFFFFFLILIMQVFFLILLKGPVLLEVKIVGMNILLGREGWVMCMNVEASGRTVRLMECFR